MPGIGKFRRLPDWQKKELPCRLHPGKGASALNPYSGFSPPRQFPRGSGYYRTVASFYVENFGCRATQADGAAIERQLREGGLERAENPAKAEIVVLNTCTVTAAADQDARAAIRRIHRQNPGCEIVVTGCYAQRAPEEIASLAGVTRVIGNSHKHQLAEIALRAQSDGHGFRNSNGFVPLSMLASVRQWPAANDQRPVFVSDIFAHTELLAAPVFDASNERTRPNLKVQDGCDNRCSFCVIPYVRGQSRSLSLSRILDEVNELVAAGYREVVISGINLGRWGRDLGSLPRTASAAEAAPHLHSVSARLKSCPSQRPTTNDHRPRFEDLICAILDHTSLEKLRISSVEPMDWSDELIRLVAESPRIAKHAHVPMQSGSDRVLRAMHRKYRPWHYREKIEKIRAAMPMAAIGADVMVGFPGETETDFEETCGMVEELPFTYLHVFTYSARPGTPAAAMRDQVPVQVARKRNRILRDLAAEKKLRFMRSFVGTSLGAITLNGTHCTSDGDFTEALTDNYLKLRLNGKHPANQWVTAHVSGVESGSLVGRLEQQLLS
jgi:threonylcarbamoyladenosine tRNA methylthiotransferase MtaB